MVVVPVADTCSTGVDFEKSPPFAVSVRLWLPASIVLAFVIDAAEIPVAVTVVSASKMYLPSLILSAYSVSAAVSPVMTDENSVLDGFPGTSGLSAPSSFTQFPFPSVPKESAPLFNVFAPAVNPEASWTEPTRF